MQQYVGIDLGTTNSAICSYDGTSAPRVHHSREKHVVTSSAIYIRALGNVQKKLVGRGAYNQYPRTPQDVALRFKREMGTDTKFIFPTAGLEWTPEECSAEILKELFSLFRSDNPSVTDIGTVVTVPESFDPRQLDATFHATELAGLGKVALVKEPIAAVYSITRARPIDDTFLIYDLGGGTFDVAIARKEGSNVDLVGVGGIERCGGRDFDRVIVEKCVFPWLLEHFSIPDTLSAAGTMYPALFRHIEMCAEETKIRLDTENESSIDVLDFGLEDQDGQEFYLNVPLSRADFNTLIEKYVTMTIQRAREVIRNANLNPSDISRIVFIGGPTKYKPLRDRVSEELGIEGSLDVDPMTAVAEGASLYAESIDWDSSDLSRKGSEGVLTASELQGVSFQYQARTPEPRAEIVVQVESGGEGNEEIELQNTQTGWTSGRQPLRHGYTIGVLLPSLGTFTFKVLAFNPVGHPIVLEDDIITITRTATPNLGRIPASRAISIEVSEQSSGKPHPHYLVRVSDPLPKSGTEMFHTTETLVAGDPSGIVRLKLWEGDIDDPITDNRFIGAVEVSGVDVEDDEIPAGAKLEVKYEVAESGQLKFDVRFPDSDLHIHSDKRFYSRQGTQVDYQDAAAGVRSEGRALAERINAVALEVDDDRLEPARDKTKHATFLDPNETDRDKIAEADQELYEAKKLLARVRKDNLGQIRTQELDDMQERIADHAMQHATESEKEAIDRLMSRATRAIEQKGGAFAYYLDQLWSVYFKILRRQDWYIIETFDYLINSPHRYTDREQFAVLKDAGLATKAADQIDELRHINSQLLDIWCSDDDAVETMLEPSNIEQGDPEW